jgi:uncharacterized protein YbjT (DUF2867 family)
MIKILIAGATGYLGSYVAEECARQGYYLKVLVRNFEKFKKSGIQANEIITAEITDKKTLAGCCKDTDIVFSSVGITRQKDGLTYMDVDYQANLNLLEEAKLNGVKKYVYVSVFNGENLRRLKICEAKEKFVDALKTSGIDYCVIRPTGYFSDMKEFFTMAEKGRVYLFGKGNHKMNPIDGEDLAKVCVDAMFSGKPEINAGGPKVLSHEQIAETAFLLQEKRKELHIFLTGLQKLFYLF